MKVRIRVIIARSILMFGIIGVMTTSLVSAQRPDAAAEALVFQGQMTMNTNTQVSEILLDQITDLDLNKASVEESLILIARKADLKLMYNKALLPTDKEVTLRNRSLSLYDALWTVLEGTGLRFALSQNRQLILMKMVEEVEQPLQEVPVSGQVTDAETNEPMPGVNVVLKGTTTGTSTDGEGNFELNVPTLQDTLVVSFIGYQAQEVPINGRAVVDVSMQPSILMGEDIIVIGYGVQERITQTNAVSSVTREELTQRPAADFRQTLQGVASGLTILDQGGAPGESDVQIRIRGLTSLSGDNSPLVLVNGIEQDIDNINPNDIESVSVLKDAASTAIYGSRGANGVILVTTQRGVSGIRVNYDGYVGIQDAINRPKHVGLETYMIMENAARENAGFSPLYTDQEIADYVECAPSPECPLPFPFFRRDQYGILEAAPQQNHSISISGGSENVNARGSFRYQTIEGFLPNYESDLKEVRINTDISALADRLRFQGDVGFNQRESLQPVDNPWSSMLHRSKFSWPKYSSGEYGVGGQLDNPLVDAELSGDDRTTRSLFTGSIKGEFDLLPNLTFSTQYALRYVDTRQKVFEERYFNEDLLTGRVMQNQINSLEESRGVTEEYTLNSILRYTQEFQDHGFSALLGYSTIDNDSRSLTGYREDFYNNSIRSISQGSVANQEVTGSEASYAIRSYFGRFNYNYNDTYLFELNARYDGSSRFAEGNRYGFFPSASIGWVVSQESFWENLGPVGSLVNEFKVRGSWGITGNQSVELYSYFETLGDINYSFNSNAVRALAQSTLANEDLTWESTKQTNVGLDLSMINNRIRFTFDYYNKQTEDILLEIPIPTAIGLAPPPQNVGSVENRGYELSLATWGGERDLFYNVQLNFSNNLNKVTDLAGTGPYLNGTNPSFPTLIIKEGLPINAHWGYTSDGLFQSQQEVDDYPTISGSTGPGDIKYVDLNGDGQINPEGDWTFLGSSFPQYNYGATFNLEYKNFGLLAQLQGAAGHKVRITGGLQQIVTFETFTHDNYADYWTPENTDAEFHRPVKFNRNNDFTSDRRMIDGDYLRLKNLVLSYNIPVSIAERLSLRNARVYIGVTNLFTISDLNTWGLDPEAPSGRASYYPQTAQYTLGINLEF